MNDKSASPEQFARQDAAKLLGYLLKLGVRFDDAQDLVAETLHRMCKRSGAIVYPQAWARSTAFHLAVDRLRKDRAEHERLQADESSPPAASTASPT